ncbi:hypothetical protein [Alkaliphilus sp. B6464]|uniref:hypothetical protein n=1 Tax=Alkaliphilus sp. B6464 TaxID=2731219 RepID=UPI001BADCFE4|nr:hypothetical protein [Alkaliphilus sp. B6464]QUH22031.1 hypothetical protein HYG84_19185 [Alkaliphilus sp. B6464]
MAAFLDFLNNLWSYFVSINANAYYGIMFILSKNWLLIFSTVFIGILMYTEMQNKAGDIIDDRRNVY